MSGPGSQAHLEFVLKVLVLKNLSASEKRTLSPLSVKSLQATAITGRKIRVPKSVYDYVLVTSANALLSIRDLPKTKKWVAIGAATRKALRVPGRIEVIALPHSAGVLAYFRKQKRGRIFFPRSNLGDPRLVTGLRKMGHRVYCRHSYETKILDLQAALRPIYKNQSVDAVFVTSPSAFLAVKKALSPRELRSWRVRWVAIGPTTAKILREAGLKVIAAPSPSLTAMKKTLSSGFTKRS